MYFHGVRTDKWTWKFILSLLWLGCNCNKTLETFALINDFFFCYLQSDIKCNNLISKMSGKLQFEVRRLIPKDENAVMELITHHFSRDHERELFGMQEDEDEHHIMRAKMKLKQNYSIGVFEKSTNKLLAVTLCTVQRRNDPFVDDSVNKIEKKSTKHRQIVKFFEELEAGAFDMLKTDKYFFPGMTTVHKDYRKLGLATLTEPECWKMAIELGCRYGVITPTTDFLCEHAKKNGAQILRELKYADYNAAHGINLFVTTAYPNSKAQLVYFDLKKLFPKQASKL